MKIIAASLFLIFSSLAMADQCQLLTPEIADRARLLLKPGAQVMFFCMSCGDQVDKSPIEEIRVVQTIDLSGMVELRFNKAKDQPVDLTSTYLKVAPKTYVNVARAIGCSTKDVPGSISLN